MIRPLFDIPARWTWKTMGDIAEVVGGGTPRTSDQENYQDGTIPWITPADLSGYSAKHIGHGGRFITKTGLETSSARMMPEGAVLFSSRAPIGYVAIASNPVCTNQGFKSFVLKTKDVLPDYVYWWLKGAKKLAEEQASGTTFLELSGAKAKQLPIPIAPFDQQQRIVAEIEKQFSRLDEAVANLKRVKANLKRYKAAVLKAAVGGKLTSTDRGNWVQTTLGSVITRIEAGKSFKCEERHPNNAEVGVAKVSAVTWGVYNEQETKTCLDSERVEPRYFIKPGDFLFSRANTIELVGACVIARKVTLNVMLSDKILRFCFSDAVLPEWVLYWLRSNSGRKEIRRLSTGNQESMRNIGQDRIRQIAFAIPPLTAQHTIVAEVERRLSVIEEQDTEVEANLKRADCLRQAILLLAFSGRSFGPREVQESMYWGTSVAAHK